MEQLAPRFILRAAGGRGTTGELVLRVIETRGSRMSFPPGASPSFWENGLSAQAGEHPAIRKSYPSLYAALQACGDYFREHEQWPGRIEVYVFDKAGPDRADRSHDGFDMAAARALIAAHRDANKMGMTSGELSAHARCQQEVDMLDRALGEIERLKEGRGERIFLLEEVASFCESQASTQAHVTEGGALVPQDLKERSARDAGSWARRAKAVREAMR